MQAPKPVEFFFCYVWKNLATNPKSFVTPCMVFDPYFAGCWFKGHHNYWLINMCMQQLFIGINILNCCDSPN